MTEAEKQDLDKRRRDDFEFLVLTQFKGNPAMYELLRDRSLDDDNKQGELPL